MGRPKIYTKLEQTTVLLEAEQIQQLKELHVLWDVTYSALVRVAVSEFLKNVEKDKRNESK